MQCKLIVKQQKQDDLRNMAKRKLIIDTLHVSEEGRDGPTWPRPQCYGVKGLPHDHVSIYDQDEVLLWFHILQSDAETSVLCSNRFFDAVLVLCAWTSPVYVGSL